jgi:hypothetical protein
MKRIASLSFDSAIDAIKSEKNVYFRSGVWNSYNLTTTEYAIERIKNSGYGADVYFNDENGKYYVSIPSSGDMW